MASVPPVRLARMWAAAALALAAGLAMLVSAALFAELRFQRWESFFGWAGQALAALLAGVLLLGAALRIAPVRLSFRQPCDAPAKPGVARWPLGAGLILLALGTVAGGRLIEALPPASVHLQFALLLAGVLVTGWALSGAPRGRPVIARREAVIVLVLALAALAVRLVDLAGIAPALIDELHFIHGINAIRADINAPLLREVSTYLPATIVYSYAQWMAVDALGRSLEGLRFVSAVAGALTIPAAYLLARALFDRRTALLAAVLLAAFPPHLTFSRLAFAHIADPLFGTWALALFALALTRGRRWAWAWGGVALGLTQYFFEGGRLLYPPLVLVWFAYLWLAWGPRRMAAHRRGMAVALLTALLVALPMYVTMAVTGAPFSSRFNDSSGVSNLLGSLGQFEQASPFSQHAMLRHYAEPFLSYVALPDVTGEYHGSDQPMVLPALVPLVLLGAAQVLWQLRAPGVVVLGGILATAAGNLLIKETLWYPRYVAAMPLLPVVMAVGLRYTLPLLWPLPSLRPRLRRAGAALMIGLALAAAAAQAGYYFGPYRTAYAVSFRAAKVSRDAQDAVVRAAALPEIFQTQVVIVDAVEQDVHVPRGMLTFLVDHQYPVQLIAAAAFTAQYLAELPRDRGYAFFLEPSDAESYRRLADAFPVGHPAYSTVPLLPAHEEYLMFLAPLVKPG